MLHESGSHNVGRNGFVGTDVVRSARSHKIIGYDSTTGHFAPATREISVQVSFAFKGGFIVGRVSGNFETSPVVLEGPITKGTGKYVGVKGHITARLTNSRRTFVTLTYHF